MSFDFKVIVDSTMITQGLDASAAPEKKHLLSIVNDFEDGTWRKPKFEDFVWNNIAETALSKREREALCQSPATLLRNAAQNLRLSEQNDPGRGSELAEIVLYGILKHKFGALSAVPKIFYKQNKNDNAKGADSVHIRREGTNDFSLWFGETKFYADIGDVNLQKVIDSVETSLNSEKLKKENSIITNVSDIDDLDLPQELRAQIRAALSHRESIDELKPRICVPILLLHQCPRTAAATELSQKYQDEISQYHRERAETYFSKQTTRLASKVFRYTEITFYLILFPVPKKEPIVESFVHTAKFHRK